MLGFENATILDYIYLGILLFGSWIGYSLIALHFLMKIKIEKIEKTEIKKEIKT